MATPPAEQAEQALIEYAMTVADRDNMVRAAVAAGVPKRRISALSGIARPTIDRILANGAGASAGGC